MNPRTNEDLLLRRIHLLPPGTIIPKPDAKADFTIKGLGKRSRETALVYRIPNHSGGRPYEKGITDTDWRLALQQLIKAGELTRDWFNSAMPRCAKEGGCNFTTIGGILSLLRIATYTARGTYSLVDEALINSPSVPAPHDRQPASPPSPSPYPAAIPTAPERP